MSTYSRCGGFEAAKHIGDCRRRFRDAESEDGENALSGEECDCESGYEVVQGEGEPPAKRAKLGVASTSRVQTDNSARTALRRGKKSLSLLPTMPLDVLFEILGKLAPKDLLNVAHTNKLFHEILLSRGAKTVWKDALKGQGVPECPSDLIEPRWTSLLFGTTCERCGTPNVRKVDFYLRRRVCVGCKKANLLGKARIAKYFPKYDETILSLVPCTNVGGWAQGRSSSQKFWWKSDIEEVIRVFATANDKKRRGIPGAQKELKTFKRQRLARVREIYSTADSFQTWFKNAASDRYKENNQSRINRLQAIQAKFLELGYDEEDLWFLPYEKECNQKAALTDNIWKRIRPKLEPLIEQHRHHRRYWSDI